MLKENLDDQATQKSGSFGVGFFLMVSLIVIIGWMFVSRASFTIGHTHALFNIQTVSGAFHRYNMDSHAIFIHADWTDPASEITRGRAYGVRVGSSVFEFDMLYAPRGFGGHIDNF